MFFSKTIFAVAAGLVTLATAQNPFTFPTAIGTITAGTPFNITWAPSTGTTDTVSLVLRQDQGGGPNNLAVVATIASKITNSGSYVWTPSTTLVKGSNYSFEIVDDGNTAITNYSQDFSINSPNTVSSTASSTASSASGASTTSGPTSISTTSASVTSSTGSAGTTLSGTKTSATGSTTGSTSAAGSTATSAAPMASINSAAGVKVRGGVMGAILGALIAVL
ncbi:hypothetical protein G7Y89_g8346 [Cudoniella acicularis]|uniref:Yeast cell wall synthesis Kre9/Knh1-like N-terminal domain-containing protein n=1 Tax=Cudoniella acicularis TaxID=354080 RepID=A0A8H4RKE8_9HELO|nr:hypothetical protein G7Y89_g8346 [Cudoniella acicularis]